MATTAVADSTLPSNWPDLEHELNLVRGAIDLITSGGATRVTLIGLQSAERLLPRAQVLGHEQAVTVRAQWHDDRGGCDLAIEALR
jgi:hypothetical protein